MKLAIKISIFLIMLLSVISIVSADYPCTNPAGCELNNGQVPSDIGFHQLRFVTNNSGNYSVDANENGILDYAENIVSGLWKKISATVIWFSGEKVGIRTNDPNATLDVKGNVSIHDDNDAAQICLNDDCISSWSQQGGTGGTFVGKTSSSYNGGLDTQGGYKEANDICNLDYSGSHLCTVNEVLTTISQKDVSTIPDWTGTVWIAGGPPGFTANANDCLGFTSSSNTMYGRFWSFGEETTEGRSWLTNCAQQKPLACCK